MKSCTVETGISNYHKLIMSICRMTFAKGKSKKFFYRCYKNFDSKLSEETQIKNLSEKELFLKSFETTFSLTLENFAPLKQKYLRYNNNPFINRTLRKVIISKSKLKRRYSLDLQLRTTIKFENYQKQRNICVNLLRKSKKQYFNIIDVKNVTGNKKFIRPKFSNKCKTANRIISVEDVKILQDEKAIANIFNNCFTDVTHTLGLQKKNIGPENTLSQIVKNFRNFESIKKIKESQEAAENSSFSFKVISEEEVKNVIKDLPINKSTISGDISMKILEQHAQIYSKNLTDIFNESIKMGKFPDILKKAEVTPVYKKGDMNDKQNYRPVSTLSNLSKLFEKLIYSQINTYMGDKFSKHLTGFRKNHNTQHAFLNMIESWKSNLNKGNKIGAIFMDLSKAFDTLDHSLLIAKLEAYGFDSLSLELMKSYLTNRK